MQEVLPILFSIGATVIFGFLFLFGIPAAVTPHPKSVVSRIDSDEELERLNEKLTHLEERLKAERKVQQGSPLHKKREASISQQAPSSSFKRSGVSSPRSEHTQTPERSSIDSGVDILSPILDLEAVPSLRRDIQHELVTKFSFMEAHRQELEERLQTQQETIEELREKLDLSLERSFALEKHNDVLSQQYDLFVIMIGFVAVLLMFCPLPDIRSGKIHLDSSINSSNGSLLTSIDDIAYHSDQNSEDLTAIVAKKGLGCPPLQSLKENFLSCEPCVCSLKWFRMVFAEDTVVESSHQTLWRMDSFKQEHLIVYVEDGSNYLHRCHSSPHPSSSSQLLPISQEGRIKLDFNMSFEPEKTDQALISYNFGEGSGSWEFDVVPKQSDALINVKIGTNSSEDTQCGLYFLAITVVTL